MDRLFYAAAIVAVVASAALVVVTGADLPPMVASHFNAAGDASGFMPRADFQLLMLALAVAIPAALLLSLGALPRIAPALVNVPNLRAWLASSRREEALAALGVQGAVGAIIVTAFIAAVQLLVVAANAHVPARLDAARLGVVVGAFVAALAVWVVAMIIRFRRPPR